jgi:EAL domain-containing protein (putative c-di-GMP-specific phosphodiesterase class I)
VARFGGDEFVILCEGVTEIGDAEAVATRVAEALRSALLISGAELVVTVSIGIRLAVGPCDPAILIADADAAMYKAKARGRGLIEVFDQSLRVGAERRLQVERSINEVIQSGSVVLHYQPVWDLTPEGPVLSGAEALLRWPGPDGELTGPVDVIEVAEETGLIIPLGAQILVTACEELARWHAAGQDLLMSVNLSARQLGHPGLVDEVEAALASTGAPASALIFEVTETALMEEPSRALDTLHRLRRTGVSLAIDDYGTGYCSLAYLSAFPVQSLKVDAAFVAQMADSPQDRTIVASVIGLAHALGIVALGEGVETQEQLDLLTEMGCDHVQGFFLGRPGEGARILGAAMDQLSRSRP